jgi:hypothetical protein
MSDYAEAINHHYGQSDLSKKILLALQAKGSPKRQADRAKAPIGFSVLAKSKEQERIWSENGRRNLRGGRMLVIRAVFERPE